MVKEMRKRGIRKGLLLSGLGILLLALAIYRRDADNNSFLPLLLVGGLALWQWALVFSNRFLRGIEAFCNQTSDPASTMARVENIWTQGVKGAKYCRMDAEYLVWGNGLRSEVIPFNELARAYIYPFRGNLILRLIFKSGKDQSLMLDATGSTAKRQAIEKTIFEHIEEHHPDILLNKNLA